MFGIDYVTMPPIAAMKAAGVTFACRYLSEVNAATKIKLLTAAEAKLLGENGIAIISNYEWYGNRASEGFASGVFDAKIAASQHLACGGPASRPIYFSVDFDTDASAAIIDYFKGVASVIGLDRVGAYGSYRVIKGLLDAGAIRWGWQTYAWSAGVWDSRAQLQQYSNGMNIGGLSVDYNRSTVSDFGQWIPGGGTPDMMPITDPWAATYFKQVATSPDRWHCARTNQDLFAGILSGWQRMNGAPRLPVGGEVKCGTEAVYQECEAGIVLYDPLHEFDAPGGPWAPCYLLKLDSDLAKKLLNIGQAAPVDTSVVVADINAITDGLAPLIAKVLVDVKKL